MKNLIKRWLGIDKLEREFESPEMLALKRYAEHEVTITRSTMKLAIYYGKITKLEDSFQCGYILYRLEYKDNVIYLNKRQSFSDKEPIYDIKLDYIVFTDDFAKDCFKVVESRYEIGATDAEDI